MCPWGMLSSVESTRGDRCVICINDHGRALNLVINVTPDGRYMFAGQARETLNDVVFMLRRRPMQGKSGNLTVTKWRTDWAGDGIALMDKCAQDARVAAQPCPPPLPPAPLAHLRAQWVKGDGGMLVLAASPAVPPHGFRGSGLNRR